MQPSRPLTPTDLRIRLEDMRTRLEAGPTWQNRDAIGLYCRTDGHGIRITNLEAYKQKQIDIWQGHMAALINNAEEQIYRTEKEGSDLTK